jgi:hypothetical protein
MLLWLDTLGAGGFFAEMEELPDAVAELCKLAVTRNRNVFVGRFRANIMIAGTHVVCLLIESYHDITDPARGGTRRTIKYDR